MVHSHNGILWNRKREGILTLRKSMDRIGEHLLSEISQVVKDISHLQVELNQQNKQANKIEPEKWK